MSGHSSAKNTAISAISSGLAILPLGVSCMIFEKAEGNIFCLEAVLVSEGAMALTWILYFATSFARERVNAIRPDFATEYARVFSIVVKAATELIFTILPHPLFFNIFKAYRLIKKALLRLLSPIRSHRLSSGDSKE